MVEERGVEQEIGQNARGGIVDVVEVLGEVIGSHLIISLLTFLLWIVAIVFFLSISHRVIAGAIFLFPFALLAIAVLFLWIVDYLEDWDDYDESWPHSNR